MKELVEKILERLDEVERRLLNESGDIGCTLGITNMSEYSKQIVQEVAEEYNNGWIPCSERLPESGVHVLCYGKNSLGSFKYEVSVYAEEIECWMCSKIADVIAWQPLPESFKDN